jgi:hypothetical protein
MTQLQAGPVVPNISRSNDAPLANSSTGSPGTSAEVSRADHVHPGASGVLLPSGGWVAAVHSENNTNTPTKNREYCVGLDLAPQRIDRLAFAVTNAPDAGAKIRVGLRSDLNLAPGLVAYEEAVAADGGTGWKQTSAITYDHPGGLLWVSLTSQVWVTTGPIIRGTSGRLAAFVRPWAQAAWESLANMPLGAAVTVGTQDSVAGALPSTFVPTSATSANFELWIKRA